MSSDGSIVLFDRAARASLGKRVSRRALDAFAFEVQQKVCKRRPFTCLVTSDAALEGFNTRYRRKKKPTDVLSFPSGVARGPLGDIAISADRAIAQAAEYGHKPADEIRVLILHGALHLMGFDHENDNGEMAKAEARWRERFGLPSSLIERACK